MGDLEHSPIGILSQWAHEGLWRLLAMADVPESDIDHQLKPPLRLHHLTGGLSTIVGANRAGLLLSPGGPGLVAFSLLPQRFFPETLKLQPGIRFLGGSQFNHFEEMQDTVISNFVIAASSKNQSLSESQFHLWGGITFALHSSGREAEAMATSRLQNQIRLCKDRLERLSVAYRTTLMVAGYTYEGGEKISFRGDKYSHYIGSEYRSLLNELYSLRDSFLVVAYRLKYSRSDSYKWEKIKSCVTADSSRSAKIIADAMFAENKIGLIERMSLYRSVAQHCLGANNPVLSDAYKVACSRGHYGALPYLVFPLYDDIGKMRAIEKGSPKGLFEKPSHEETLRFVKLENHIDALEFSYDCYVRMLRICEAIADEVGIQPQVRTITDDDMIEATFTDREGKVSRARRDKKTGKLAEY
jgi:hypothetical protein